MNERDFKKVSEISKSIADFIQDRSKAEDILVWKAWRDSVGEIIFSKTTVRGLVKGRLAIDVEDERWRKVLLDMKDELLQRVNSWLGETRCSDIVVSTRKKK